MAVHGCMRASLALLSDSRCCLGVLSVHWRHANRRGIAKAADERAPNSSKCLGFVLQVWSGGGITLTQTQSRFGAHVSPNKWSPAMSTALDF